MDEAARSTPAALVNAQALAMNADGVVAANNAIFGITQTTPVNVLLYAIGGATDGTGGADHAACTFLDGGNIEVCFAYGDDARVAALFEAELSECAMQGQLCGLSTGEALSRWCTMITNPGALADFASVPTWAQDGFADFVNNVDPTDQNYDSIGCGMAFISYLIHRGSDLPAIAQAMVALGDSGTLAQLYEALKMGVAADAWQTFLAAVKALPAITSDDPFNQVTNALKKVVPGVARP
jgi:hypothetical protein